MEGRRAGLVERWAVYVTLAAGLFMCPALLTDPLAAAASFIVCITAALVLVWRQPVGEGQHV